MPKRATKRGAERTPLSNHEYDVLICGASFGGLAVTRELRDSDARVLVLDRYDIGERATSACVAPTQWLQNLDLAATIKQTFEELVVHTPKINARWPLPWTFSTFDYPSVCRALFQQAQPVAQFETATVTGRTGQVVHTDRGDVSAPLIVDALGWRRILGAGANIQPPNARLSRGLEIHPFQPGSELEIWIDKRYVPAGYAWSFPADDESRVGVGSFDPHFHVKEPTVRLATDLEVPAERYQGNWIPHQLRPATEEGIFFVGDSAGHCLPLTAEGIRPALYFGLACGRELRAVLAGRQDVTTALSRYHEFSAEHAWFYRWMLRSQHTVPRTAPTILNGIIKTLSKQKAAAWAFENYLKIAPPGFTRL